MNAEFYKDSKGETRWRIRARNGRILAASSEGFKRPSTAERNLDLVKAALVVLGGQRPADDDGWMAVDPEKPRPDGRVLVFVPSLCKGRRAERIDGVRFGRYVGTKWIIEGLAGDWEVEKWRPIPRP